MALLSTLEQQAVQVFIAHTRAMMGITVVSFTLFGSRARGEGNEESDLDILVLVDDAPAKVRGAVYDIATDVMLEYDVDISPLVMSKAHFQDMRRRERLLARDITNDGVQL